MYQKIAHASSCYMLGFLPVPQQRKAAYRNSKVPVVEVENYTYKILETFFRRSHQKMQTTRPNCTLELLLQYFLKYMLDYSHRNNNNNDNCIITV